MDEWLPEGMQQCHVLHGAVADIWVHLQDSCTPAICLAHNPHVKYSALTTTELSKKHLYYVLNNYSSVECSCCRRQQ